MPVSREELYRGIPEKIPRESRTVFELIASNMKPENQVRISELRDLLYRRMHYDNRKDYFDILWSGWRQWGLRHGEHSRTFYTAALLRGSLKVKDANSFCDYACRGWRPFAN